MATLRLEKNNSLLNMAHDFLGTTPSTKLQNGNELHSELTTENGVTIQG